MTDMSQIESRKYSVEELSTILKEAGVKPNSSREVKIIVELEPNGWLYGITGFSKSSGIILCIVKGWETETGTVYIQELCNYPLKVKVLDQPLRSVDVYSAWK